MRVLVVYLGRRGGGAIYTLEIAKHLKEKVEILAIVSSELENYNEWKKQNIPLVDLHTFKSYSIRDIIISTLNICNFIKIRKIINCFKPDIIYYPMIHLWTPIINFVVPHIPKVITIHDPKPHKGEENIFLSFIQNVTIKQSKRIIVLSKTFVDLLNKYSIPREKIDVIPHGNFAYYTKGIKKNYNKITKTILFFGRIKEYKGLDILLKAFSIIREKDNNVKLIIAGEGDISVYKTFINKVDNIELINRWINENEIPDLFLRADIVVLPYIDASQSGVIPLAYSFGIPVIASKVGGIPEQIEDGITGLLFSPEDYEDLAYKCLKILNDIDFLKKLAENAYIKAYKEINWEKIVDLLIETFNKALNS